MAKAKRTYADACGIARALDAVGDRWALMVVRELIIGPKRFSDIRAGLPKLSADVLAERLRGLEEVGVVLTASAPHLFAVVRGVRDLADAQESGELEVEGDRALAQRFFELFPLPDPAPAA